MMLSDGWHLVGIFIALAGGHREVSLTTLRGNFNPLVRASRESALVTGLGGALHPMEVATCWAVWPGRAQQLWELRGEECSL